MTHDSYKVLIIRWGELVEKLVKTNCKSNSEVISVKKHGTNFIVKTNGLSYTTKKIYFALEELKRYIKLKLIKILFKLKIKLIGEQQ